MYPAHSPNSFHSYPFNVSQIINHPTTTQLKLLRVVVKNLGDPTKSQDPKYRQLRLSNKKVEEKLLPCPSAVAYMKAIGFDEVTDETDGGARYLRIGMEKEINVAHTQASLVELTNAIKMVDPDAKLPASGPPSRKSSFGDGSGEEKKTSQKNEGSQKVSSSTTKNLEKNVNCSLI